MHIEERWRCPGCGNRRRLVWNKHTYYCFNCQNKTRLTDWQPASFTAPELTRLAAYKGAVKAGVYSDAGVCLAARSTEQLSPDWETHSGATQR